MKICYVDVETLNWFDEDRIKNLPRELQILAMNFGIAVTYDGKDQLSFFEDKPGYELWDRNNDIHLAEYLIHGHWDMIAGWNIITFDLPIIFRSAGKTIPAYFPPVFDPFDIIRKVTGRYYNKLEIVAQANLGRGKIGDGKQAAGWLRDGAFSENYLKAAEYCRMDVELERDLCQMILDKKPIILPALDDKLNKNPITLTIDWPNNSYTFSTSL